MRKYVFLILSSILTISVIAQDNQFFLAFTVMHIPNSAADLTDKDQMQMENDKLLLIFSEQTVAITNQQNGVQTTIVLDDKKDKAILFLDTENLQTAIEMNTTELEELSSGDKIEKIIYLSGTKVIHGYPCKQAITIDETGKIREYWYAESLQTAVETNLADVPKLPGLVLEFIVHLDEYQLNYTLKDFQILLTEEQKALLDVENLRGYTSMTFEEFQILNNN